MDVLVTVLEGPARDDVDGKPEDLGQLVLEVEQVEERAPGLEVHEEVDVALVVVVATAAEPNTDGWRGRGGP